MNISESSCHESIQRRRAARPWRRLSVLAGAMLAIAFFLPVAKGCNSDVIPVQELRGLLPISNLLNTTAPWYEVVSWIAAYLAAYLTGLVLVAGAMARLAGWNRLARWPDRFLIAILLLLIIEVGVCMLMGYIKYPSNSLDWQWWLLFTLAPLTLIYLGLIRRPADRLYNGARFITSFCLLCWFTFWFFMIDARYGLYLSLLASALLLLANIAESRVITGQTWPRTIGQLLIGRLAQPLDMKGCCPQCEYSLRGLTEQRCPECGRLFTLEEVHLTHDEAGTAILGRATDAAL